VRQGDAAAARELVQSFHPEILRLACSILDDPAEAEDVAQDVFLAALRSLDSYRGDAAFKTWLFSITVNLCRRRWRQRQARERLQQVLGTVLGRAHAPSSVPEEIVMNREDRSALWRAVDELGEKYRLPLALFYGQELSVAEIAQVLGIPVGTVLSRLHAARERLATRLVCEQELVMDEQVGEL
jgi:RNA polymerase sigma-70 factor (ECF subfamily)